MLDGFLPERAYFKEFRRGFVSTIDLESASFLTSAAALVCRGTPSSTFGCQEVEDYVADIASCPVAAHARVLDLSQCGIGAADAIFIAESSYLENLETLDLSGSHSARKAREGSGCIIQVRQLTGLLLGGNAIGATGVEAIAATATLTTLATLDVSHNGVGAAGFMPL